MRTLFETLKNSLKQGKNSVLCSIIASSGSTPRGSGAKMLVFEDGSICGTIGGGAVEYRAICLARDIHKSKISQTEHYLLHKNDVADIGMICGGDVTVYFRLFRADCENDVILSEKLYNAVCGCDDVWLITEISEGKAGNIGTYDKKNGLFFEGHSEDEFLPYIKKQSVLVKDRFFVEPLVQSGFVYIFGGGHVSQQLVPVIAKLGFRPVIVEDREKFTDPGLFDGVYKTIEADFSKLEESVLVKPEDYIVIMTRGHMADFDALEFALKTPASYIGLIGSKKKMASTLQRLRADGIDESQFSRIHNPIGIEIKAETPEEIAISIAAQLILHRAEERVALS